MPMSNEQQTHTSNKSRKLPVLKILLGTLVVIGTILVAFQQEWFSSFACGTSQVKDGGGNMYGTVLAEDGRCWLDRNLGASRVATSPTDTSSYGWYFQWGRGADGHQISTSDTTSIYSSEDVPGHADFILDNTDSDDRTGDWRDPQNNNLWQGLDGINNPCPAGFRVPTQPEWGLLAYSANMTQSSDAFSSALKLPLAGHRWAYDREYGSKHVADAGEVTVADHGYYWSSSAGCFYSSKNSTTSCSAFALHFGPASDAENDTHPDFSFPNQLAIHIDGFSVRCIKD
jgi:uncharacterized protein (TIGR02145 family)